MNITHDNIKSDVTKPEMEMVENKKQEYKLVGKFLRTKGLNLYCYDPNEDKVIEVETSFKNTAILDQYLRPESMASEEATIDPRHEHFEALNLRTAVNRVERYKQGKLKELSNLKKPTKKKIELY